MDQNLSSHCILMLVNVYCLNIYFSDISLWDVLFDKQFVLDKQFINTMVYFSDGSTVNVAHMWRKTGIFKENFVSSLRLCTLNQFPTLLSMETNAMHKSNYLFYSRRAYHILKYHHI